ncbi:hypothetical protein [Salinarimonas soli]|uniref:CHAT domain-containing protein n=1 Tax=Salinarimonas soli TaxID=1638099 RepID=A0A5B2VQR1_9HYPH|nr:hypothetical protein [Salinarimonas soli]KAA2242093.1 hypothetical protein F0L46_03770 [Salinarimonas soli]
MGDNLGLAVMESRWERQRNISVKSLFDVLSDIHLRTTHGFIYEMFGSKSSFREVFKRLSAENTIRRIYIATHGSAKTGNLTAINDDEISKIVLRNTLRDLASIRGAKIRGLYLGSCYTGTKYLADFIFYDGDDGHDIPIKWLAGYSEEIDWIQSAALDLLFWSTFYDVRNELRSATSDPSELKIVKQTAALIKARASGLCDELGFEVWVRSRSHGTRGLIASADSDADTDDLEAA